MKDVCLKILDKIMETSLISAALSFVIGSIITFIFIPKTFIDTLPFDEHNWNVVLILLVVCAVVFLFIALIKTIFNKVVTRRTNAKERKYTVKENQIEIRERIEEVKSIIDSLSDYDYGAIKFLMDNENKVPFKQKTFSSGYSILDEPSWFVSSPYENNTGILSSHGFKQYLLTEDTYKRFKEIIRLTGSLSHFDRQGVKFD